MSGKDQRYDNSVMAPPNNFEPLLLVINSHYQRITITIVGFLQWFFYNDLHIFRLFF